MDGPRGERGVVLQPTPHNLTAAVSVEMAQGVPAR